ncbi:MAG: type VII secretion protein EccCa [Propionibacteriaceae bacterium]|nr:type VII secretion protein EccCa [Propionibacteriaceae bacterium]
MAQSTSDVVTVPVMPTGSLVLETPPDKETAQGGGNVLSTLLPMVGSMGVMVFMAISNSSNPRTLLMSAAMVVAMLSMAGVSMFRQIGSHRNKIMSMRREYLAYLAEMRETTRTAAALQRKAALWTLPTPDSLALIASQGQRRWERSPISPTLLQVRVGASDQELSMELTMPELAPLADPDPVCYSAATRFVDTHKVVDSLPLAVTLTPFAHVDIGGDAEMTRALARAMTVHLATFVSPSLLTIAVLCSPRVRPEWEWVKWLPHARSTVTEDDAGPSRLVVSSYDDLAKSLGDITTRPTFAPRVESMEWPHLLLIVDDAELPVNTRLGSFEGAAGVTVLTLVKQWEALTMPTTLRLLCRPPRTSDSQGNVDIVMLGQAPVTGVADGMTVEEAEAAARRLTPDTENEDSAESAAVGVADPKRTADLAELLGIGDIRDFDQTRNWRRRSGRDLLRVPFGITPEGIPVSLDIKESAQGGMGPHGLIIGATGSGKSEVLRTLVLALALTHSPEQLNFVLVDFKGGATFAGMSGLPHVSAMISNLESELTLVDRMADALRGEISRRYELLRRAGNFANVTDYEAARLAGKHDEPPLPALFVILDEFSELLTAKPEFIDIFVQIGRVGRSLSIHLLLSSQRLEEGKLRGLDSHLSYRIGLRTFSAAESRVVLGVTDAANLPALPGIGFLKLGSDQLVQFRASYVAAPPRGRAHANVTTSSEDETDSEAVVVPFSTSPVFWTPPRPMRGLSEVSDDTTEAPIVPRRSNLRASAVEQPTVPTPDESGDGRWEGMTQIDIGVALMSPLGPKAHQVWLPPLETPDTLDELMPDLAVDPTLGLISHKWRDGGRLVIPLGTVDIPLEQRRQPLVFDLSGAGGNLAVAGGPLTGKSTFLRSLVLAVSLTMTPAEAQFYIIDFGGGTFAPFNGAPHVAGVVTRDQTQILGRVMAEIEDIMANREAYFLANKIDSMATYRSRRANGQVDDGRGDIFLIVDGWTVLKTDFDQLEPRVQAIATRGLGFGIHVIVSVGRWADLRQQLKDVMGTKFELRLGDPTESVVDRKMAVQVPEGRPGRGIDSGQHHVLTSLPRIDGDSSPQTLGDGVTDAISRITEAWTGSNAPKLKLLPTKASLKELRVKAADEPGLILGVEERHLDCLRFDPARENHLALFGDQKSGKTTFLRSLSREITRTARPEDAQVFLIDVRRSSLGEVPEAYLASYMATREDATEMMGGLAELLKGRLPSRDVTPEQLRTHSWWKGASIWVLVDDYDLVATQSSNPLAVLQPYLAQAADVGLHLVVTRRSGGAARQAYDPVLQALTELGATGIMLSGSPDETPVYTGVKFQRAVPGRAQVISRDLGRLTAQLAWSDPTV